MSTITKEQAKDLRNAFECWQQDYDPVEDKEQHDMFGLGVVAMDALLASLEAEPVAWLLSGGGAKNHVSFDSGNAYADPLREVTPLYTAPPAPVALTSGYSDFEEIWSSSTHPLTQDDEMKDFAWDIWNACRAAILQRAEPVQGWIPCSDRMPTKNHRVLIFINFNSDTVPPSIHDAQFTGSTFRRGNATVNVFPLEDGYGVTHWMPLPAAPQQEA